MGGRTPSNDVKAAFQAAAEEIKAEAQSRKSRASQASIVTALNGTDFVDRLRPSGVRQLAGCGFARGHHTVSEQAHLIPARGVPCLRRVYPLDQSCWTGAAVEAAFATGVIVARLRAINAARMRYVIGTLPPLVGRSRCPASVRYMDVFSKYDNPDSVDWIYALSADIAHSAQSARLEGVGFVLMGALRQQKGQELSRPVAAFVLVWKPLAPL
jgi:hypothetical protein